MTHPIINIADVNLQPFPPCMGPTGETAERFEARMGRFSAQIGAQKLGYNITAVPPGKRAFPLHCHRVNEEMFFILEGSGEVRIGDERHAIRAGDVIACPPGGPEKAHQIINTGATEMRYLAVSTKMTPEICEYPDTGKYGIMAEYPPGADGKPQVFRVVSKPDMQVGYWDDE
ncbi:cupin domain-containing protein [Dyella solisilvae]|uniref:Cupin domain-containing protein n=1 Tax=Dyella solisilvae TaxID=1920168 RepID=A0A370KBA9_9GAMM|nr:cupin domain-containing protein [Dyella solisilvae]RDI99935.1 cupin domain-containing protein [Dyella solisilvae]